MIDFFLCVFKWIVIHLKWCLFGNLMIFSKSWFAFYPNHYMRNTYFHIETIHHFIPPTIYHYLEDYKLKLTRAQKNSKKCNDHKFCCKRKMLLWGGKSCFLAMKIATMAQTWSWHHGMIHYEHLSRSWQKNSMGSFKNYVE